MDKQFKEVLVMNLMYNLLLAIVLSIVAQILSFGTVMWPAVLVDMLIAYVLEMVIALAKIIDHDRFAGRIYDPVLLHAGIRILV